MRKLSKIASIFLTLLVFWSCAPQEPGRPPAAVDIALFEQGLRDAGVWSGGPDQRFMRAGRNSIATAIRTGLNPTDKVLDIGAGSLRVGWWFLQFVEPSNYYAVEPVKNRIDTAARLIGADIHIDYNSDWEFPPVKFDYVIARSIWSHASKAMISKMLSEFAENSAPDGRFLTSVLLARNEAEDYLGDEWVGKVEKDGEVGVVHHLASWIEAECKKNGLKLKIMDDLFNQTWVLITHADVGR